MNKLLQISGRECIKVLERASFHIVQQRGSHVILRRNIPFTEDIVPDHKILDKGILWF